MIRKKSMLLAAAVAASLTQGLASQAQAGSAKYLSKDATHCEIFRSLSKVIPIECAADEDLDGLGGKTTLGKTRGLVIYGEQAAQPAAVVQKHPPKDLAIAMRTEFAFDSFELGPEAKQVLDRVAAVLTDDLMDNKRILIEGHADASGSEAYNLRLSTMRARAVSDYLIEVHKISKTRLVYTGKGEAELFDPQNPNSGINRRAEFRNLSD